MGKESNDDAAIEAFLAGGGKIEHVDATDAWATPVKKLRYERYEKILETLTSAVQGMPISFVEGHGDKRASYTGTFIRLKDTGESSKKIKRPRSAAVVLVDGVEKIVRLSNIELNRQ